MSPHIRKTPRLKRPSGGTRSNAYVEALRRVLPGEVVTYAEVGLMAIGNTAGMGASINAGKAINKIPTTSHDVPWWRAIRTGRKPIGSLLQTERADEQRQRLQAEGVDLGKPCQRTPDCLPAFLASSLASAEIHPSAAHTCTLVFLHGRAYTPSYYCINKHFFQAQHAAGLRVVLPASPALFEGKPLTQWFSGWPPGEMQLEQPRREVLNVLDEEVQKLDGDASRVFLGGCSQGCILGLDVYMRCPHTLGGFCGLVGYWPSSSDSVLEGGVHGARLARPIRLLNGARDDVVPWEMVCGESGACFAKLKKAGFTNLKNDKPEEGLGHHLGPREGRWISAFLDEVLLPD